MATIDFRITVEDAHIIYTSLVDRRARARESLKAIGVHNYNEELDKHFTGVIAKCDDLMNFIGQKLKNG